MILWLASFSRSGNDFFWFLYRKLYNVGIYLIYPQERAPIDKLSLQRMASDAKTCLIKAHELPSEDYLAIYLVRDRRDPLVSLTWFSMSNRDEPMPDSSKEIFNYKLGIEVLSKTYTGWSSHALGWTKRPTQTTRVKLEDLISEPDKVVSTALETAGTKFKQVKDVKSPSFGQVHKNNLHLYQKEQGGWKWKTQMPFESHNLFCEKHRQAINTRI